MAIQINQSSILEAKDQLFLDSADASRLNEVTSNIGLKRPAGGFADYEWRAGVRKIAFRRKLVKDAFRRCLEVCVGPQYALLGQLSAATAVNDTTFTLSDPESLLQLGTVILDPGLATQETLNFTYRSPRTGIVELSSRMKYAHSPLTISSANLSVTANVGSSSLSFIDSSLLPSSGYPYPIITDRGSDQEELLVVTNNNTGAAVITLQAPTQKKHTGPVSQFLKKATSAPSLIGHDFLILATDGTKELPSAGTLRINKGQPDAEVINYIENDVNSGTLKLASLIKFNHAQGVPVDLVTPGALVETSKMVQFGIHWKIWETALHEVQVFLPSDVKPLKLQDASWLHGPVLYGAGSKSGNPAPTAKLLVAATTNSTILYVDTIEGFTNEAGIITVGSTLSFYDRRDETT